MSYLSYNYHNIKYASTKHILLQNHITIDVNIVNETVAKLLIMFDVGYLSILETRRIYQPVWTLVGSATRSLPLLIIFEETQDCIVAQEL